MKKLYLLIVLVLLSFVVLEAQPRTGLFAVNFQNGAVTSNMYFFVPEDYDSTKAYPMLYGWHGAGMPGNSMRDLLYLLLANELKIIVCCPDANNLNGQPTTLLTSLINRSYSWTLQNYNIDENKITITGFSWGGAIAYQLGLLNPDMFKGGIIGLAPAIGSLDNSMWANIKIPRMATILGTLDFNWTAVNALMNQITSQGSTLLYKVKEGVEHVDNDYFNSQEFVDDYRECYQFVINETSPVEEPALVSDNSIIVSPNPASEYIKISGVTGEIKVFDLLGIEVLKVTAPSLRDTPPNEGGESVRVDVSFLMPGVYFVRMNSRTTSFIKE